jgi:hypothetical protein
MNLVSSFVRQIGAELKIDRGDSNDCTKFCVLFDDRDPDPSKEIMMTSKPEKPKAPKIQRDISHPGMMGDGTQEQSLGERGNPDARIKKDEVDAAFGKQLPKKSP